MHGLRALNNVSENGSQIGKTLHPFAIVTSLLVGYETKHHTCHQYSVEFKSVPMNVYCLLSPLTTLYMLQVLMLTQLIEEVNMRNKYICWF